MLNWQKGRQEGGYDKLLIMMSAVIPFDIWLLRFPEGSHIAQHVDPVEVGHNHYRLNIIVKPAKRGGEFRVTNAIINWRFLKLFRPDVSPHSVTQVDEGTRYVLSIGWLTRKS